MGLTSTPFLSYSEISVSGCDLVEDAFNLKRDFNDVYSFLGEAEAEVPDSVITRLISLIDQKKQEKTTGL